MDNEPTERRVAKVPISEEDLSLMEGIFGVKLKDPDESSVVGLIRAHLLGITHCLSVAVDRIENLEDGFIREHMLGKGNDVCWTDRGKSGEVHPSRFHMCPACRKINENRETRKQLKREREERARSRESRRREVDQRIFAQGGQRGKPGAKAS